MRDLGPKENETKQHDLEAIVAAIHKIPDEDVVAVLDVPGAVVRAAIHLKDLQQIRQLAVDVTKKLGRCVHLVQHGLSLLTGTREKKEKHMNTKKCTPGTRAHTHTGTDMHDKKLTDLHQAPVKEQ